MVNVYHNVNLAILNKIIHVCHVIQIVKLANHSNNAKLARTLHNYWLMENVLIIISVLMEQS